MLYYGFHLFHYMAQAWWEIISGHNAGDGALEQLVFISYLILWKLLIDFFCSLFISLPFFFFFAVQLKAEEASEKKTTTSKMF